MKKIALAVLAASTLFTTPAAAADGNFYVGIEGGLLFARDEGVDASYETESSGGPVLLAASATPQAVNTLNSFFGVNYDTGRDVGLVAGYDFGLVRAELELSNKRASHDSYNFFLAGFFGGESDEFVAHGKTRVNSAMLNVLLDVPVAPTITLFAGPGVGLASAKMDMRFDANDPNYGDMTELNTTIKDSSVAFQGLAGVRVAVTPQVELGAKYRYFEANKLRDDYATEDFICDTTCSLATRFRSHSLLATLTYSFAPPVAAPAPVIAPVAEPAPAPATQTCADGSVVLATDTCPMPPAPPAPTPTPERG